MKIGKKTFNNVMKCVLYRNENRIHIGDIFIQGNMSGLFGFLQHYTNHINKGYGTQMMNMLIEYAKENNYKTITGNLSEVDNNTTTDPHHKDRQIHFYKKFGFKILPDEENPKSIELIVK
jgi:GNAT superfamily N-acetyltransferase